MPGHSASFGVAPEGVTTVSYFATDAAANRLLQRVAVLRASDAVSGIATGSFQVNATSNEPMDPSDVAVTEDENGGLVVELRAERSGAARQVGLLPDGQGAGPGRQRGDRDGHLHRSARQRQGEVA